mmetsp:Transcript_16688/g.68358  ORF Transcript_16688/g.68358 Transcript_16688/m.68358 type:complete len:219 (+) Transcript_16688:2802-3458(+)
MTLTFVSLAAALKNNALLCLNECLGYSTKMSCFRIWLKTFPGSMSNFSSSPSKRFGTFGVCGASRCSAKGALKLIDIKSASPTRLHGNTNTSVLSRMSSFTKRSKNSAGMSLVTSSLVAGALRRLWTSSQTKSSRLSLSPKWASSITSLTFLVTRNGYALSTCIPSVTRFILSSTISSMGMYLSPSLSSCTALGFTGGTLRYTRRVLSVSGFNSTTAR